MLNGKNCNNESNPLEGVADALVSTISTVSVLTLQIASNTLILGSKALWQGVELIVDVANIFYKLANGTYEYKNEEIQEDIYIEEVASTENNLLVINKDKIESYKTNNIDAEYIEINPLTFREIPKIAKYKSNFKDVKDTLKAYVGVGAYSNQIEVDFFKNGSLLVGGMSQWGKTSAVRALLTSLMERYTPKYLRLVLVDFKKIDLIYLDEYSHVLSNCITTIEHFKDLTKWVEEELERRQKEFNLYKIQNIKDYNIRVEKKKMQPVIIVIDEISILFSGIDKKEADNIRIKINSLVSRSMAFGIYWIVCTQELSRETLGKMKNNFGQTIGFHTKDKDATDLIIKDGDLHLIENKGRAKIETSEGIEEFQSYFINLKEVDNRLKDFKK